MSITPTATAQAAGSTLQGGGGAALSLNEEIQTLAERVKEAAERSDWNQVQILGAEIMFHARSVSDPMQLPSQRAPVEASPALPSYAEVQRTRITRFCQEEIAKIFDNAWFYVNSHTQGSSYRFTFSLEQTMVVVNEDSDQIGTWTWDKFGTLRADFSGSEEPRGPIEGKKLQRYQSILANALKEIESALLRTAEANNRFALDNSEFIFRIDIWNKCKHKWKARYRDFK